MISAVQNLVRAADSALARAYLSLREERSGLLTFLFHSLFRDASEPALNLVDPLQRTTVEQFREFVAYYRSHGYQFVGPDDLLAGLEPGGRYALITFDDGYFNNTLALPVLEEFGAPALVFVSTEHVRQGKSFWWDVLYRERAAEGASDRRIYREALALKRLRTDAIEVELTRRFGPKAFQPRCDIDRPFTVKELRSFARHPLITIGNHTADHAILTNYTAEEIREQVAGAQRAIRDLTGVEPLAIAYPNGAYSPEVLRVCGDLGLRLGFTIRPEKNPVPHRQDDPEPGFQALRLGRFAPHGEAPILGQCRTYRSDVLLYGLFRDGYLRLVRGQATP